MTYLIQQLHEQQQQQQRPPLKKPKVIVVGESARSDENKTPKQHHQEDEEVIIESETASGNEDEIELGEVVSIEKLKNTTVIDNKVLLGYQLQVPVSKPPEEPQDHHVSIPRKMLPIVSTRILDWFDKCVELAVSRISPPVVDSRTIQALLGKSWAKLLLVYMIENCFAFYVTRDISNPRPSSNDGQPRPTPPPPVDESKLPKEKEAYQLMNTISRGNEFALTSSEYDLLKEILLYREGN